MMKRYRFGSAEKFLCLLIHSAGDWARESLGSAPAVAPGVSALVLPLSILSDATSKKPLGRAKKYLMCGKLHFKALSHWVIDKLIMIWHSNMILQSMAIRCSFRPFRTHSFFIRYSQESSRSSRDDSRTEDTRFSLSVARATGGGVGTELGLGSRPVHFSWRTMTDGDRCLADVTGILMHQTESKLFSLAPFVAHRPSHQQACTKKLQPHKLSQPVL